MTFLQTGCFLALLLGCGHGFVVSSKVDLPYPSLPGVPMDSSLSPKIVKAFYEINFVPNSPAIDPKWGLVTLGDGLKDCSAKDSPYCKYFLVSKSPTIVKVDDMIENLVKKDGMDVPIIQGYDPTSIKEMVDSLNKSIKEQTDNQVKVTSTTTPPSDTTVPVYKGTIDTDAVLNKEDPTTRRPYPYRPNRPYQHSGNPFNRPHKPYGNYQPTYQEGWNKNPCFINPCPQWGPSRYPTLHIDGKL